MLAAQTASDIVALRTQLMDGGWNPVPASPVDKACHVTGWPTIETSQFHIENWSRTNPAHTNTALVCNRNYFAVDIDIASDADLAQQVQALAFQHLGATDFIRIGRAPKRLLVYRQAPGSIRSVGYKLEEVGSDGVEILATGKLFTAFGMHPTGAPYTWIGDANPAEDTPTEAPFVTQEQVDAFLDAVHAVTPFASTGSSNGAGRPHATDTARRINAEGLVEDGRENLLRDCIWKAANEIAAAGDTLTAETVAGRGWDLFVERAVLNDGKYSTKDALAKARGTVRRITEGRVTLGPKMQEATITFSTKPRHMTVRAALKKVLRKLTTAAVSMFVTITEILDA